MRRCDGAQRDRVLVLWPLRGKRKQNNKDAHIESSLTKSISNFRNSRHILDGGMLTSRMKYTTYTQCHDIHAIESTLMPCH